MADDPHQLAPLFRMEVTADSRVTESVGGDQQDLVIGLLRQLLAGQQRQNELLQELVQQARATQRQRASESASGSRPIRIWRALPGGGRGARQGAGRVPAAVDGGSGGQRRRPGRRRVRAERVHRSLRSAAGAFEWRAAGPLAAEHDAHRDQFVVIQPGFFRARWGGVFLRPFSAVGEAGRGRGWAGRPRGPAYSIARDVNQPVYLRK